MPEQPKHIGGPQKEPVIYTIPDQFYGLAAKAQLPKESAAPTAAPAGAVREALPPPPASEKGSKAWILIPIIAVLLLGGIGIGIWLLLRPKPAPPATPSVTLPTTPAPQPEPEPVPEPEPEPEPAPEPATTTPEVPPASSPSDDADADGLTTAEEALYGTDASLADSDDDGFSDSVEVINLYNPAGFRPTRLVEAGLVKAFMGSGFELLYPTSWSASDSDGGPLFRSPTGEGVTVEIIDNPKNQSSLDWYIETHPSVSPSEVQPFSTKSGLEGVRTPDGFMAYIAVGDKMYGFYQVTEAGQLSPGATPVFPSTFMMLVNSFSAKP